jgi:hypothetical protein
VETVKRATANSAVAAAVREREELRKTVSPQKSGWDWQIKIIVRNAGLISAEEGS